MEMRGFAAEIQKIGCQRLRDASLILGDVACISASSIRRRQWRTTCANRLKFSNAVDAHPTLPGFFVDGCEGGEASGSNNHISVVIEPSASPIHARMRDGGGVPEV